MDNTEVPEVYATADATVVIDLQPEQALALFRILAHYDEITRGDAAVPEYVPEVWHHVMIQLQGQRGLALGRVAELQFLDTIAAQQQPRHLALVGDDQ